MCIGQAVVDSRGRTRKASTAADLNRARSIARDI
jgi:hypothetical protein